MKEKQDVWSTRTRSNRQFRPHVRAAQKVHLCHCKCSFIVSSNQDNSGRFKSQYLSDKIDLRQLICLVRFVIWLIFYFKKYSLRSTPINFIELRSADLFSDCASIRDTKLRKSMTSILKKTEGNENFLINIFTGNL